MRTHPGRLSSLINGNLEEPDLKGFLSALNSRGLEMISWYDGGPGKSS